MIFDDDSLYEDFEECIEDCDSDDYVLCYTMCAMFVEDESVEDQGKWEE